MRNIIIMNYESLYKVGYILHVWGIIWQRLGGYIEYCSQFLVCIKILEGGPCGPPLLEGRVNYLFLCALLCRESIYIGVGVYSIDGTVEMMEIEFQFQCVNFVKQIFSW